MKIHKSGLEGQSAIFTRFPTYAMAALGVTGNVNDLSTERVRPVLHPLCRGRFDTVGRHIGSHLPFFP
jgi:uncharacterized membrane protein YadS